MLASGARITIWDRDIGGMGTAAEQLKKMHPGAQVACVHVDVALHASVVQATAQTLAIAPVYALVNSAGITGPNTKLWDYPVDDWRQVFDINVHGLFHCCRELSAHMRARSSGLPVVVQGRAGRRLPAGPEAGAAVLPAAAPAPPGPTALGERGAARGSFWNSLAVWHQRRFIRLQPLNHIWVEN
jgi:3-oxoacyl-[acyl-carrier protein] reductase